MKRLTRRRLLASSLGGAASLGLLPLRPLWAQGKGLALDVGASNGTNRGRSDRRHAKVHHIAVTRGPVTLNGRTGEGVFLNGGFPGPLLRWREGDHLELRVTNHLSEDTSIHWHGILLPYQMDGVPGVTFAGIPAGETFTYRFPVKQAGTYWYHSHSGLQEQIGHYGPIVIDPAGPDPVAYDREHILVLSDWAFEDPHRIFSELKTMGESLNFQKRTLGDLFNDFSDAGWSDAVSNRLTWGKMRMTPTDIADVGGITYTYLINGTTPEANWTGLFTPGERVRLRIINASAMTLFNVRIPDLPMTVVQADGLNVQPVETDEFQIGVAETYDAVVKPETYRAYTIMCEAISRTGFARATLAPQMGMTAAVPPLRPKPLLTMKDMGMAHHAGMNHAEMQHSDMNHDAMAQAAMDHGAKPQGDAGHAQHHQHAMPAAPSVGGPQRHDHPDGPGVMNMAMAPTSRLHEPGIGLEDQPHRTLTYADLRSLEKNPDLRTPGRNIELHLTSNMHRYMWSFDGVKFSEVTGPIVFREGERLRMTLVNDTMMPHPIHLHGMFFQLVNGETDHKPNKHTVVVKPGEKLSIDISADAVGDWAFHCHLLYHMHAGMFRVVTVQPVGPNQHEHHTA